MLKQYGELQVQSARQVEKFLQALLEAEKLVPVIRVSVEHLQAFTEVSQGVEGSISTQAASSPVRTKSRVVRSKAATSVTAWQSNTSKAS